MREDRATVLAQADHCKRQVPSSLASEVMDVPTVAALIAGLNAKLRAEALGAAERHYSEVAWASGCSDEAANAWVRDLMSCLRQQIDNMREGHVDGSIRNEPRLMEKVTTKVVGGLLISLASPLLLFIWVGLKIEGAAPAIAMQTTGRFKAYSFVLGSSLVSVLVRRAELRALPSLWHLVNGDTVIRYKDWGAIINPWAGLSAY